MPSTVTSPAAPSRVVGALLPVMTVVFVAFLVIGLALPVLPLHVHQDLRLGTVVVGLVTGSQFAASLVSRVGSGHYADSRGAKRAVVFGLVMAVVSGLLYLASLAFLAFLASPVASVTLLLLGRALLGGAESFIITGALGWGLALVDARSAGKVIAWIGTAMYAAFAIGAPLGSALYAADGFAAIALATTLAPLVTLGIVAPLRGVPAAHRERPALLEVAAAIWLPGLGLSFGSIGFGAITAFVSLLFVSRGWTPVWLAFTGFAGAFIVARMALGHLPDRHGGARVALVSALIEAAGLAMIWVAPDAAWALAGAILTGLGYSLVYPGLGVEAVRRVPPQSRGLALGAFTAFLDLALGVATPLLGLAASWAGLGSVFLVGAVVVLGAAAVSLELLRTPVVAA